MEGSGGRHRLAVVVLGAIVLALGASGCGSSLFATTSGTSSPSTAPTSTTSTTAAVNGVAVGIPVVGCSAATSPSAEGGQPDGQGSDGQDGGGSGNFAEPGDGTNAGGWRPSFMLAPVPTAVVSQVEFYSDGIHTVLAPAGWACNTLVPSPDATELVVYPADDPDPPISGVPGPGGEGVFATFDTTGEPQGVSIVCPFFTVPAWQEREAHCFSGHVPNGEQTSMPTPDVVSVTDPAGVFGSLPGSGGQQPVIGVVIFPQIVPAVTEGDSIDIAEESCSLSSDSLCPTILSDFEVREFPVPSSDSR